MAYNDQEIELKLALSESKFIKITNKLEKEAKFIKASQQTDDYYTPKTHSFLETKYPFEWLSVRYRDGKASINYKHWYPENTKYTTHCDEYETEVSDKNQVDLILKALNFIKFVSVKKKRRVFSYSDSLEIALDEVQELGYFIEVETIKDFGSVEKAREIILIFTKSLGLKDTKTIPGGYASALMRKKGISFG
jgi:adenylate cyclase class 2